MPGGNMSEGELPYTRLSVIQCTDVVRGPTVLFDSELYQQGHQRMVLSIWKGYVRSEIMSVKKSRHNSWRYSPWLLQLSSRWPSCVNTGASATCIKTTARLVLNLDRLVVALFQHYSSRTGCPLSVASSSSRSQHCCTIFFTTAVLSVVPRRPGCVQHGILATSAKVVL